MLTPQEAHDLVKSIALKSGVVERTGELLEQWESQYGNFVEEERGAMLERILEKAEQQLSSMVGVAGSVEPNLHGVMHGAIFSYSQAKREFEPLEKYPQVDYFFHIPLHKTLTGGIHIEKSVFTDTAFSDMLIGEHAAVVRMRVLNEYHKKDFRSLDELTKFFGGLLKILF
jgi:hypothetical protein